MRLRLGFSTMAARASKDRNDGSKPNIPVLAAILQVVVSKFIAEGVSDLFSESLRVRLGRSLEAKAPGVGVVQKALGRLMQREILIRMERGQYSVQDEVFLEWLKRR
jgi:hypothetical protein